MTVSPYSVVHSGIGWYSDRSRTSKCASLIASILPAWNAAKPSLGEWSVRTDFSRYTPPKTVETESDRIHSPEHQGVSLPVRGGAQGDVTAAENDVREGTNRRENPGNPRATTGRGPRSSSVFSLGGLFASGRTTPSVRTPWGRFLQAPPYRLRQLGTSGRRYRGGESVDADRLTAVRTPMPEGRVQGEVVLRKHTKCKDVAAVERQRVGAEPVHLLISRAR